MAAILAALGLMSSKKAGEEPAERKSIAMTIAETSSQTVLYMEKIAKDIVANAPDFGKARVPIIARHRDKESLLVEIIDLKKALEETEIHLHMHKQYYLRLLEDSSGTSVSQAVPDAKPSEEAAVISRPLNSWQSDPYQHR